VTSTYGTVRAFWDGAAETRARKLATAMTEEVKLFMVRE
jgi:hypothetical protein